MRTPIRIFVVENSSHMLEAITSLIGMIEGASVAGTSGHASDAIRQIAETSPDVVILDIRLVSGTGLEVLQAIRATAGNSPITVVLSSYMPEILRRMCFEKGADYAFKATDFDQLENLLRILANEPPAL